MQIHTCRKYCGRLNDIVALKAIILNAVFYHGKERKWGPHLLNVRITHFLNNGSTIKTAGI